MNPLLSSSQICKYLGISYRRFLQYTQEDPTFPARKVGGEWKADPDELEAWFKNQPGCAEHTEQNNVVQMPRQKRRGRPPKRLRPTPPPGGWKITIPD